MYSKPIEIAVMAGDCEVERITRQVRMRKGVDYVLFQNTLYRLYGYVVWERHINLTDPLPFSELN